MTNNTTTASQRRLRLLLLGIAILLSEFTHSCFAASTGEMSKTTTTTTNKRDELLTNMIEEYLQLSDFELQNSKMLIQKVLADQQVVEKHSDLMDAEKRILENFVRQVTDKEKEEPPAKSNIANRFFYLIAKSMIYQEFEAIVRRHNTASPYQKFSPENYLIELSLNENGLSNLQSDVLRKQGIFMNEFVKEVETYLAELTPTQRKDENGEPKKMNDWLDKMKAETDVQQKMEIFKEFMRFFVKL